MKKEYDFSQSVKNPYVKKLDKQVTINPSAHNAALSASLGEIYNKLQNPRRWVTARMKSYGFFLKIIAALNPPYES